MLRLLTSGLETEINVLRIRFRTPSMVPYRLYQSKVINPNLTESIRFIAKMTYD